MTMDVRLRRQVTDHIANSSVHTSGGAGETNTASNRAAAGVFSQKSGVDLQFRGITAGSNKLSVTLLDPTITIDATEANFTHDNIGGTLSITKGGTGQTTATAAFNALDPLTTKGDIIVHNGTDSIRLGIGVNAQVLKADSSQAAGLRWADETAPGGGGGAAKITYINRASRSGDASTTSTSFVDMPNMSITFTPANVEHHVVMALGSFSQGAQDYFRLQLLFDGVESNFIRQLTDTNAQMAAIYWAESSVTAAQHNVRLRWAAASALTLTNNAASPFGPMNLILTRTEA